ncbi:hypothetical protein DPMN_035423 [Dreissena polymorpha]|uniref:ZSWIM4-8 C-terminal domain-containing protein n=1 Tax=Dreissena polymorpha TaxID=45954 RepID=A0A9D4M957_DREPO|nr:hypothetical protein DPMN_035423 [Dreissena polymorpha]
MEIGSAAIHILIDTWEGHLTAPEVASLADRASRGRDHNIVKAAAELALSCLPQAQALNPSEVQRALYQCKEQSKEMLEKACLAVESAAKGYSVYPEVLFHVAKRWYELAEEAARQSGGENHGRHSVESRNDSRPHSAPSMARSASSPGHIDNTSPVNPSVVPFSNTPPMGNQVAMSGAQLIAHGNQLPPTVMVPFTIPPVQSGPHHPHMQQQQTFVQPTYNIVQQIHQPFGVPPFSQTIPMHPQSMPPYVTFTYNNAVHYNLPPTTVYSSSGPYRPLIPGPNPSQGLQVMPGQMATLQGMMPQQASLPMPQPHLEDHHHVLLTSHIVNPTQAHYLHAAFRVGMLAMETLARRIHDDRPQSKYARNPPNGEDVKWLLKLAMKLGNHEVMCYSPTICVCNLIFIR